MPLAWVRPASASPSPPDSRGNADRHARAASRTSTRASASWVGHVVDAAGRRRLDRLGQLPGGVLEVAGRVAVAVGVHRMARRAARSMSDAPSSSVAAWVTRAVSSWASSMTTVS